MRFPDSIHRNRALALVLGPVATLFVVGPTLAQGATRVIPKHVRNAFGGGHYGVPDSATWPSYRYQLWISGNNLSVGTPIRQVSVVQSQRADSVPGTEHLTLKITDTTRGFAGMGSNLDTNLGSSATTVFSGTVTSLGKAKATAPNTPLGFVTLQQPFVFRGPNLLIEWTATNRKYTGSQNFDGTGPQNTFYTFDVGPSCGGRLTADYANNEVMLTMVGAPAGPVMFLFGVENYWSRGVNYPFDLSRIGMPGCQLGFDPMIAIPMRSSSAFVPTRLRIPATPPGDSAVAYAQGVHQSFTNPTNQATTNTRSMVLGDTGVVRDVLSSDSTRRIADGGWPRSFNTGITVLIR